jgi:hypothetical protein
MQPRLASITAHLVIAERHRRIMTRQPVDQTESARIAFAKRWALLTSRIETPLPRPMTPHWHS